MREASRPLTLSYIYSMKKKNNPLFTKAPTITAVIVERIDKRTVQKALAAGADMLEIRVDTFRKRDTESLVRALKRLRGFEGVSGVPLLLTCRDVTEGGVNAVAVKEKKLIFKALMPFVDCIDIELRVATGFRAVITEAREAGVAVIVSYHDFKGTPGAARLEGIIRKGRAAGGDAVKIAATAECREDLKRLAAVLLGHSAVIIIAMGPQGKASRLFFPLLGSLTTYGSVTKSSAPGQMPVAELVKAFKALEIKN